MILFAIYTLGLIEWAEKRVTGVEGLSYVDDVEGVVMGGNVDKVVRKPEACDSVSIDWAERLEREVDTAKTEVTLFTLERSHMSNVRLMVTATIGDGNSFVGFNKEVTRWLGAWMDTYQTFNKHHSRCMKTVGAAEARLRSLPGMYGVVPACVKAIHINKYPGCCDVRKQALVGSKGRQLLRQPPATDESTCQVNPVYTPNNDERCANERLRAYTGAGGP